MHILFNNVLRKATCFMLANFLYFKGRIDPKQICLFWMDASMLQKKLVVCLRCRFVLDTITVGESAP